MPADRSLSKWVRYVILPVLLVPLALAIHPVEGEWFVGIAAAICFCAPLGGLWWGEEKGLTDGTRAGIGCLATLGLFALYSLWAFVLARMIFDR